MGLWGVWVLIEYYLLVGNMSVGVDFWGEEVG